jgi:putative tRNA adenosine deaminase-associated protein
MGYFAAALMRSSDTWVAEEVDLTGVEDLDSLTEVLRDLAAAADAKTAMLYCEEDDEYLAIVRVDGDSDPRVFLSDVRAVGVSPIASMLYEEAAAETPEVAADDDDDEVHPAEPEPVGDHELLADLGIPGAVLLDLCAEEGMLPADVMTAVCERAGCVEALEELR